MTQQPPAIQDEATSVRNMRVISVALAAGVVLFLIVVIFLHLTSTPPDENLTSSGEQEMDSIVSMLSWAHLAMVLVLFPLAFWIRPKIERKLYKKLTGPAATASPIPMHPAAQAYQAGLLAHLAILEGVALFGVVICLLAVVSESMGAHPLYWLNSLSALIFVAVAFTQMPTRESLHDRSRQLQRDNE